MQSNPFPTHGTIIITTKIMFLSKKCAIYMYPSSLAACGTLFSDKYAMKKRVFVMENHAKLKSMQQSCIIHRLPAAAQFMNFML